MFYILILILDTVTLKRYAKNSYINGIIMTLITMCIFTGEFVTMTTIIITSLAVAINILIHKIKNLKNKSKKKSTEYGKDICYGFYLGVANILTIIYVLAFNKFLI